MLPVWRKAFDRGHLLACDLRHGDLARPNRLAVDMNGAGTTKTRPAAKFGAGQLQLLANHPKQGRVGLSLDIRRLAIDRKSCCSHAFSLPRELLSSRLI